MKGENVIAFGAHPDDVEIGMGGTLVKLAASGYNVYIIIGTVPDDEKQRIREAKVSAGMIGCVEPILLSIEPLELGFNRMTIAKIDEIIRKLSPVAVFTHWSGDSHQDHINIAKSVISASRHNIFDLFMYEQTIPGGITNAAFRPQMFVDISDHIEKKMSAVRAYETQIKRNGEWWLEGIIGRAMYRGYQIRTKYAEAFEVIKVTKW